MRESIVPPQEQGSSVDIVHSATSPTREEALGLYRQSCQRLLDVNNWDTLCGTPTAKFEVTDKSGKPVGIPPREGFYFRIAIPAPGPFVGEGYDWVNIETIEEHIDNTSDEQQFSIRVRPAPNPTNKDEGPAHFFSPAATSTFRISRRGLEVAASVHGRNETANTETESVVDNLRNTIVSTGARAGFSTVQWNKLVKGLIEGAPSDQQD